MGNRAGAIPACAGAGDGSIARFRRRPLAHYRWATEQFAVALLVPRFHQKVSSAAHQSPIMTSLWALFLLKMFGIWETAASDNTIFQRSKLPASKLLAGTGSDC